jgi:hypothetical protein
MKGVVRLAVGLVLALLAATVSSVALGGSRRVVVTFHNSSDARVDYSLLVEDSVNATVVKQYGRRLVLDMGRPVDIEVDAGAIKGQIGAEKVESVELDYVVGGFASAASVSVTGAGADSAGAWFQWNLADSEPHSIKAERIWNMTNSTPDLVVAVLDTGLASVARGAFLSLAVGYDFISDVDISLDGDGRDWDATDPGDAGPGCSVSSWHGTKVASIIGAGHDVALGLGMRGVAQNCTVMPVRVLGLCSSGYANDVADAVVYSAGGVINGVTANPSPAKVISMSLAGPASVCPSYLQSAITQAIGLGAIVIAAAGNEGLPDVKGTFPANCRGVISVGASVRDGSLAVYSNKGATMLAPGGDWKDPIAALSVSGAGKLVMANTVGTIMAAQHVAGRWCW